MLWKKGSNYRDPRTIRPKRCNDNVIDGLYSLIKEEMSSNKNVNS